MITLKIAFCFIYSGTESVNLATRHNYDISAVDRDTYGRPVAAAPVPLPDGAYDAKIILETVSPISFLIR